MKRIMNLTTNDMDLERYSDNEDLKNAYRQFGLDGLELMDAGEDVDTIVRPDDVLGVHLKYFYHWLSLWEEDADAILTEYGTWDVCREVFGGTGREAVIESYRRNLDFAKKYNPEYAVFHVCDVTIGDSVTRDFKYTDIQVIDAVIDLVNTVFTENSAGFTLLFENLWWTGLTMEKPELLERLLSKVKYPKLGVMLDIGHLLHTNRSIRSLDDGIDYIYRLLDRYDNLDFIKGIHLHQTLSGEYVNSVLKNPFPVSGDYYERLTSVFGHLMKIDSHKPFISDRIPALVERIAPEYLVFEYITSSREEYEGYLRDQLRCFDKAIIR